MEVNMNLKEGLPHQTLILLQIRQLDTEIKEILEGYKLKLSQI